MKKLILTLLLSLAALSIKANDQVDIKGVKIDSLFRLYVQLSPDRVFYKVDTTDNNLSHYFKSTSTNPLNELQSYLSKIGYSFTKYEGNVIIIKGIAPSLYLHYNFFDREKFVSENNEHIDVLAENQEVATLQNKIYEIGDRTFPKVGAKAIIRGNVSNIQTGEPIVGAGIFDEATKTYAESDQFGNYSIQVNPGEVQLNVQGYSMEDVDLRLIVYGDGILDIGMKERVISLRTAVVSAESNYAKRRSQLGVDILRIDRIKHVPSVFGEADVLKILLTLPGVKSVGEASGGFNVRGGTTDQNLILFNEGTIYNPTHLFGLFSAFNPDIVSDVELYKSSIPPQYGGRISSVLEVRGREGNKNKITGSAGLGLLTSRAHLEGPISEKTNFIVGGRTTYSNWILGLLPEDSEYRNGAASFHDLSLGMTHNFNEGSSVYFNGYYSMDGFKFNMDTSFNYNNLNASLKWRKVINDKNNFTTSIGYDRYSYNTIDTGNEVRANRLDYSIEQAFLKFNMRTILSEKHVINWGLNSLFYNLMPGAYTPYGEGSLVTPKQLQNENALESAIFINDNWTVSDKLMLDLGVRFSGFYKMNENSKFYCAPELRISGRYLLSSNLTIKAGFNSMQQYIHMLSNTATISPTDTWKLSDDRIRPQNGWQAATGLYSSISDNIELSLEGYYKVMNNYLDYKSGAVIIMNENIADDVVETRGRAYGVELMIKKNIGKLNGWVSYNYSKTQLKEDGDRGKEAINMGEWYNAAYDKPHDIKLVGNYKFTQRYSLSVNVDYATGRPITVPIGRYYYAGGYRFHYSDRNQFRIPDYFRVDAAINIEPSHKLTQLTHFSVTFGVYNVTARKNAYSVFYKAKGESVQGYLMTVFGTAIPYININLKF